jgi:hypothetical protein
MERLRDRIGNYYKYVDNTLINNPDPRSSHFATGKPSSHVIFLDDDRYNKNFAEAEKEKRDHQGQRRRQLIEQKRIEKYERDLKRW